MSDEKKIYEPYHEITQKEINLNIVVSVFVLVIGIILLAFGLNEPLFTSNEILFTIFDLITKLGDENMYIAFFCIFYFGVNKKFAKRLIIGFTISLHLTDFFKGIFLDPRPDTNFINDIDGKSSGYGLPSGHTSGSFSFWGYTFYSFKGEEKKIRLIWQSIAIFIIIMVPISRLVIGVHDLQDIIGGAILGLLVLTAFMYFEPKISSMYGTWSLKKKILIGVAISLGLWIFSSLMSYVLLINNPDWIGITNPDWTGFQQSIYELSISCGILIGAAIAFPLEEKYVKYDPNKLDLKKTLLATLIGLIITFGAYFLLTFLFGLAPDIYFITRGIKYILFIVIGTLGVPPLLNKIFKL